MNLSNMNLNDPATLREIIASHERDADDDLMLHQDSLETYRRRSDGYGLSHLRMAWTYRKNFQRHRREANRFRQRLAALTCPANCDECRILGVA